MNRYCTFLGLSRIHFIPKRRDNTECLKERYICGSVCIGKNCFHCRYDEYETGTQFYGQCAYRQVILIFRIYTYISIDVMMQIFGQGLENSLLMSNYLKLLSSADMFLLANFYFIIFKIETDINKSISRKRTVLGVRLNKRAFLSMGIFKITKLYVYTPTGAWTSLRDQAFRTCPSQHTDKIMGYQNIFFFFWVI